MIPVEIVDGASVNSMGTQGLVSIVKNREVIFKIVTGTDGYLSKSLVECIKQTEKPLTVELLYDLALKIGFGYQDNLVVMDRNTIKFADDDISNDSLYRTTFQDPNFNPRWRYGTADYVEILYL